MKDKYIIFSDLDGTLLDHFTYSFEAALPALTLVKSLNIRLILTSSKTLPEIKKIQKKLDIIQPFIVENGGAICLPKNHFQNVQNYSSIENLDILFLSTDYETIINDLEKIKNRYAFRGYHSMSVSDIVSLTGLEFDDAEMAKRRICSEPLVWKDSPEKLDRFQNDLKNKGYRLLKGGRFYHVIGNTDKGKAALELLKLFKEKQPQQTFKTIGIGDSSNDLDLLNVVDIPVLVKRPDETYVDNQLDNEIIYANGIGPVGWASAVNQILTNS
jgi:mannosyl-3-phosphoglycerate phosphatase